MPKQHLKTYVTVAQQQHKPKCMRVRADFKHGYPNTCFMTYVI